MERAPPPLPLTLIVIFTLGCPLLPGFEGSRSFDSPLQKEICHLNEICHFEGAGANATASRETCFRPNL